MAGMKEVRDHIKSVEETLKITNAMYLIASSSLRKARKQLEDTLPYFEKISSTISDILHHSPDIHHAYFDQRADKAGRQVGYIVITGDKGLAGAYNHNVLKLAEESMCAQRAPTLFVIGQMGRAYFSGKGIPIDGEFLYTAQDPTMARAREIGNTFVDLFLNGQLDEVWIVYTKMVNPLRLEPVCTKLLPLERDLFPWQRRPSEHYTKTVAYLPSESVVLDQIVPGYLKGMIFGALVESYCSEQNARMTAMDSATENARKLLKDLNLTYNRARQSAITQEISEIVGGAAAEDQ
ncbi:ATP synthase F1 subunit gamma [Pseudoflavonifractor phocaeensis]|uniref:ATP synthase F1 subunit gamma n=1 Tax=Pseudoflavonifractor phocaeensis TaxID=1870988 RepID=UPI00313E5062